MPFWKNPARRLLSQQDEVRVVDAIRRAEGLTSGEIRVHVEERCDGDPMEQARVCFAALGMTATAARNGVLLYFAVADRRFAVVGDEGIHTVVGPGFWEALRDRLAIKLREGHAGDGIVESVLEIGEVMSGPFPAGGENRNELSDAVSWTLPRSGDPPL